MSQRGIIEHLEKDSILRDVLDVTPFPEYINTGDLFEDLASCILDMRIHYAGSNAAFRYKRLKGMIDGEPITPDLILDMPPVIEAALKLSRQKKESLELLAKRWLEEWHAVDWSNMSDEEVSELLQTVKGIGKWSIQMILMFTLERPDLFPNGDYQLRKAMCEVYSLDEDDKALSDQLEEIASGWAPYRSVAVRYLWKWRREIRGSRSRGA